MTKRRWVGTLCSAPEIRVSLSEPECDGSYDADGSKEGVGTDMLRFMAAALSTPANPSATRLIQGDINADAVPAMNVFVKATGPVDATLYAP